MAVDAFAEKSVSFVQRDHAPVIRSPIVNLVFLRKAQENPEDYRDMLVRVAGYSTQFVNLSREAQDAIIERTTYDTM